MKIAIYEPDPRICGPDSWAAAMRSGFRDLGHHCDVVSFTKSGKPQVRWGVIHPTNSASRSCSLQVDVVDKQYRAGAVLDMYDLVVLTDIKAAQCDKEATYKGELPSYINALRLTKTPFTSALHGKLYFEQHEAPEGWKTQSGSDYVSELLELPNFTGVLAQHANNFDMHCKAIRDLAPSRIPFPLPYKLQVSDEQVETFIKHTEFGSNGRLNPNKCHLVVALGLLDAGLTGSCVFRGVSSVTIGPAYSLELMERLMKDGFKGEREGNGGVKSAYPWWLRCGQLEIRHEGAYTSVVKGFADIDIHISVTDGQFSGGLLEFATLEAIDAGCLPIVTSPFDPHYTKMPYLEVTPMAVSRVGAGWSKNVTARETYARELAKSVARYKKLTGAQRQECVMDNRYAIAKQHDPRLLAQRLIDACL